MRKYIDSRCLSAAMMRKFTDITLTYKCFRRVHPLKYIIRLRKWRKHRLQEMRGIGRHVDRGYQCGRLADIRLRATQIVGGITATIEKYMMDMFTSDAVYDIPTRALNDAEQIHLNNVMYVLGRALVVGHAIRYRPVDTEEWTILQDIVQELSDLDCAWQTRQQRARLHHLLMVAHGFVNTAPRLMETHLNNMLTYKSVYGIPAREPNGYEQAQLNRIMYVLGRAYVVAHNDPDLILHRTAWAVLRKYVTELSDSCWAWESI
jgi:hypothetical protein